MPLVETMPLTSYGMKPAARSAATRIWMEAAAQGRARVAALRAPDFYGPDVPWAYLGNSTIGALAKGKAAFFVGSPDIPHDYAYVPDIARAATTADRRAGLGVQSGLARSVRADPHDARDPADRRGRARRPAPHPLPARAVLAPLGLFSPFLREMREMRFQWDRPYRCRCEQIREDLLVRRHAVRGGRARDGAVVPKGAAAAPLVKAAPAARR